MSAIKQMRTVLKFRRLLPFNPTDIQKFSCFPTTVSSFWTSPSTCHTQCFIHVYSYIRNKVTVTCFCCRSDWRQGTSGSSRSKRITGGPWQTRTTRPSGACCDKYSYNAWSSKQLKRVVTEWNLCPNCSKLVTIRTWWGSPLNWGSPICLCGVCYPVCHAGCEQNGACL